MREANLLAMLSSLSMTRHLWTLVVVSAVLQCFMGGLWYGLVFRKSWRKLVGIAEGEKPKNQLFGVVASLIACFVLSFVLANIINLAGSISAMAGASIGILCWFGFMAPPLFTQHIFENRRANLFAINAAYWLLVMALGGAVIGGFSS